MSVPRIALPRAPPSRVAATPRVPSPPTSRAPGSTPRLNTARSTAAPSRVATRPTPPPPPTPPPATPRTPVPSLKVSFERLREVSNKELASAQEVVRARIVQLCRDIIGSIDGALEEGQRLEQDFHARREAAQQEQQQQQRSPATSSRSKARRKAAASTSSSGGAASTSPVMMDAPISSYDYSVEHLLSRASSSYEIATSRSGTSSVAPTQPSAARKHTSSIVVLNDAPANKTNNNNNIHGNVVATNAGNLRTHVVMASWEKGVKQSAGAMRSEVAMRDAEISRALCASITKTARQKTPTSESSYYSVLYMGYAPSYKNNKNNNNNSGAEMAVLRCPMFVSRTHAGNDLVALSNASNNNNNSVQDTSSSPTRPPTATTSFGTSRNSITPRQASSTTAEMLRGKSATAPVLAITLDAQRVREVVLPSANNLANLERRIAKCVPATNTNSAIVVGTSSSASSGALRCTPSLQVFEMEEVLDPYGGKNLTAAQRVKGFQTWVRRHATHDDVKETQANTNEHECGLIFADLLWGSAGAANKNNNNSSNSNNKPYAYYCFPVNRDAAQDSLTRDDAPPLSVVELLLAKNYLVG